MSALLSQLMRFASGRNTWGAIPFSLKIQKTTWSVATDGFVLFAVKMAGATTRKDYPKNLVDYLVDPPTDAVELDVPALKAWAGDAPNAIIAAGDVDQEHQGVLFDHAIDRRKLAYLFAKMVLPKVNAWVVQPGLIGFEHPQKQWRALLACLSQRPEGDELVFKNPTGAAPSMMDMLEELGSE